MGKKLSTNEFRSEIIRLTEQDPAQAARLLAQRTLNDPPFHEYPWLAKELAQWVSRPVTYRLGILSTFTLEPVRDILQATALAQGFDINLYFGGFQQLEQEIIIPGSGLNRHEPQGIVLAWSLQDISPILWQCVLDLTENDIKFEIENVINRISAIIQASKTNFPDAQLLVHTFTPPEYPALGVIDYQHSHGHRRAIDDLNAGLLKLAAQNKWVHLVDCASLARRAGTDWFDARNWYTARARFGPKGLNVLASEYIKYVRAFTGKCKKVLVTDLDGTLWGGILGEDGVNGIALGPNYPGNAFMAFQHEIKQLSRRGVILVINSKNNEAEVREAFAGHKHMVLKWDDFVATRVNWQDKIANMRELAETLSLGLDSFVFIDDNLYECDMMRQSLPEVTVVQVPREPSELPGLLSNLGLFDSVIYSEEDRKRGEFYRLQARREELKNSSTDLESFYRSLAMRLTVYDVGETQISRVAQLTQRTNQFNMTTNRYTESDIKRFIENANYLVRAYRLEDRFGDNGIISVLIIRKEAQTWYIDTFLMSCRVIGRTVETAILAILAKEAYKAAATSLSADFLPTKKNVPAKDVYPQHGFKIIEETSHRMRYKLSLPAPELLIPDWFEVVLISAKNG